MKNIFKLLVFALALACGAPDESIPVEGYEFGTLEQPIFMPNNYGVEGQGGGLECVPPWSGGMCLVPDHKTISMGFSAGTCSTFWQTRAVEAVAEFEFVVDNLGDDWSFTGGGSAYNLRCAVVPPDANGDAIGAFGPSTTDGENHPTEFGTLFQYRSGTAKIDTAQIEALPSWNGWTNAQKQRFARNAIRHELGHMIGLGHSSTGCMASASTSADCSYTAAQIDRLRCYNEDSGTGDDC